MMTLRCGSGKRTRLLPNVWSLSPLGFIAAWQGHERSHLQCNCNNWLGNFMREDFNLLIVNQNPRRRRFSRLVRRRHEANLQQVSQRAPVVP